MRERIDLTPYIQNIKMEPETTSVRWTPYRYIGWRAWWRRLTFRPVESPWSYEFEATLEPNEEALPSEEGDVSGFSYSMRPVGEIRKVRT